MLRRDFLASVAASAIWTPWSNADESFTVTVAEPAPQFTVTVIDQVAAASRYAVTLHTTTDCAQCERMKTSLRGDPRLDVSVELNTIPAGVPADVYPFITFTDHTGRLRYNLTARTAKAVVEVIERSRTIAEPGAAGRRPSPGPALVKMAGYHTHTCRADGTRWGHPLLGRITSHNCPKCARVEYRKD